MRSSATAAAAAALLLVASGTSGVMAEAIVAVEEQSQLSDSFDEGIDQSAGHLGDEHNDIYDEEVSEHSGDYGASIAIDDDEEEERGIIIEPVTNPLIINRDPLAEELRTIQEMRRQLQEASEGNGGFTTTRNKKYGGKFLSTKLRDNDNGGPDESAANARKNGRFDGLKALQKKLNSDIDTEIAELDTTKADLEAEYSALAEEIAELEMAEANEEKREALLEEKKGAMHIITEKMAEHEAAKVDCDHAMRSASKKKKVLDEIAGECDELRTKLDHTKVSSTATDREMSKKWHD